jgi:hypothetical protein
MSPLSDSLAGRKGYQAAQAFEGFGTTIQIEKGYDKHFQ